LSDQKKTIHKIKKTHQKKKNTTKPRRQRKPKPTTQKKTPTHDSNDFSQLKAQDALDIVLQTVRDGEWKIKSNATFEASQKREIAVVQVGYNQKVFSAFGGSGILHWTAV